MFSRGLRCVSLQVVPRCRRSAFSTAVEFSSHTSEEVERSSAAPDAPVIAKIKAPEIYFAESDPLPGPQTDITFKVEVPLTSLLPLTFIFIIFITVSFEDVSRAMYRIRDGIRRTVRL
jgi:hypothetical protein